MQDEIWQQFGIQNYNSNVLSVYSVGHPLSFRDQKEFSKMEFFLQYSVLSYKYNIVIERAGQFVCLLLWACYWFDS